MKFAENLKLLRDKKRLSQTDLAKHCHVSQNAVSNYEAGNREPEIKILVLLAQALDTSLDILILGEENKLYISKVEFEELKDAKKAFGKLENCLSIIENKDILNSRFVNEEDYFKENDKNIILNKKETIKVKFAENLRLLRKKKGLSQTELAKYCHISQNAVSNYEAGIREPEIQILILLSQALNVSLDLLILGDDDKIYISREEYEELRCAKKAFDKLENCLNAIEDRGILDSRFDD